MSYKVCNAKSEIRRMKPQRRQIMWLMFMDYIIDLDVTKKQLSQIYDIPLATVRKYIQRALDSQLYMTRLSEYWCVQKQFVELIVKYKEQFLIDEERNNYSYLYITCKDIDNYQLVYEQYISKRLRYEEFDIEDDSEALLIELLELERRLSRIDRLLQICKEIKISMKEFMDIVETYTEEMNISIKQISDMNAGIYTTAEISNVIHTAIDNYICSSRLQYFILKYKLKEKTERALKAEAKIIKRI